MIPAMAAILVFGYLIGAIPSGLIIAKAARGIDIRQFGSGKIGFANVLRSAGVRAGAATLAADVAKGTLAAYLGGLIIGTTTTSVAGIDIDRQGGQVIAALAAVLGHNWSVYIRFGGGRGVDTALGGLMSMSPLVASACLAIGCIAILGLRYVSVGSIIGTLSSVIILAPLVALGSQPAEFLVYGALATLLVVFQHRDNLVRLWSGTERRLGEKGHRR